MAPLSRDRMEAFRLNARAARDAPLAPMDALAAMLSSPPPPSIPSPTAPSPQVAADEPRRPGGGVFRVAASAGRDAACHVRAYAWAV